MKKKNINFIFKNDIVEKIFKASNKTNTTLYLVGGIVRDILLKKSDFNDIDFVYKDKIDPLINKLKEKINFKTLEFNRKNFRTIRLCFKNLVVDFQKLHKNNMESDSRKRDFTINSLYMDYNSKNNYTIIDFVNGLKHIDKKIIIPVSKSCFKDDPLRILRMYRLKATDNFKISNNAEKLSQKQKKRLPTIANERIKDELKKIFTFINFELIKKMINSDIFFILFDLKATEFNIKLFKNNYLLNITSFFYFNHSLDKLDNILEQYTFSKKDIRTVRLINSIRLSIKKNISEKKFVFKYKSFQKKYLAKAFKFFKKIDKNNCYVKYLNKILSNYKFLLSGTYLIEKFNVKGEKLGKLINKMHTFQIIDNIRDKSKLINKFQNN